MQGCCVCQHHKEQFDGCGTQDVGEFSDGWQCTESPTEYQDAGCGTWETCEERIAKENGWTDRNGHKCEDYEENPEMCDDAHSRSVLCLLDNSISDNESTLIFPPTRVLRHRVCPLN